MLSFSCLVEFLAFLMYFLVYLNLSSKWSNTQFIENSFLTEYILCAFIICKQCLIYKDISLLQGYIPCPQGSYNLEKETQKWNCKRKMLDREALTHRYSGSSRNRVIHVGWNSSKRIQEGDETWIGFGE